MIEVAHKEKWNGTERRKPKSILYLDDSADDLTLFSIRAEYLGFKTTTVKYASDFINEFETGIYDIALVDFVLSSIDGISISRLIHRDRAPNTKLYIYTAYNNENMKQRVLDLKIDGIINKVDDIKKALAEVLSD